jgi:hypothetical protein
MKSIITKYHGPTDFKGSRISASDGDGNRVFISYPSELRSEEAHANAVKALCKKMSWTGEIYGGDHPDGMVWVFRDNHNYIRIDP